MTQPETSPQPAINQEAAAVHGLGSLPTAVTAITQPGAEVDCLSVDAMVEVLAAEGEKIDFITMDLFDNRELLTALNASLGQATLEYFRHTMRFFNLPRDSMFGPAITLSESEAIVDAQGRPWREETGSMIDLDKIRQAGADPAHVIYFRVTQPATEPKPERFWTSDFMEVKGGLNSELGRSRETAIILVSTLDAIAQNGGLIRDINDDNGIAVRQIGTGTFDQAQAITTLSRQ